MDQQQQGWEQGTQRVEETTVTEYNTGALATAVGIPDGQNVVSIKLQSGRAEHDEQAEVLVSVNDPTTMVERVLTTISNRFPPESVVTVTPGGMARELLEHTVSTHHAGQQALTGAQHLSTSGQYGTGLSSSGQYVTETRSAYDTSGNLARSQVDTSGNYGGRAMSAASMGSNIVEERIVSSTIISEIAERTVPQDFEIRYVEVPVIEEVIRHVPKKEVREIEKIVPKIEVEWIERVVEIPQLQIIDKHVEVPQIQEVIREIGIKQVIDVPKEYIKEIKKIVDQVVVKEIEVPGQIIEVPKPYQVENTVTVPRYQDSDVATVVAQTIMPIVRDSNEVRPVDAHTYEPRMIAVDVFVPLPVQVGAFVEKTLMKTEHRLTHVPAAHFNSLLKISNTHLTHEEVQGLLLRGLDRVSIPLLPMEEKLEIVTPLSNEWMSSYISGKWYFDSATGVFIEQTINKPMGGSSMAGSMGGHMISGQQMMGQGHQAYGSGISSIQQGQFATGATTVGSRFPSSVQTPVITGGAQQRFSSQSYTSSHQQHQGIPQMYSNAPGAHSITQQNTTYVR